MAPPTSARNSERLSRPVTSMVTDTTISSLASPASTAAGPIRVCGGNIGAIQLLYGSENGIRTDNDQYFGQRSNGSQPTPASVTGSERLSQQEISMVTDTTMSCSASRRLPLLASHQVCGPVGAIMILYGTENGTTSVDDDYWGQRSNGVGYVGVGDEFGAVVTTGDLNEDGYDDVIIGVGETVSSRNDAGAVQILYGSATGSITDGAEMLYVSQSAFTGTSQTNARFGSAITAIGNDLIIETPETPSQESPQQDPSTT